MIPMKDIASLSPDNCFIAISKAVGKKVVELGGGGAYNDMRRVIVASIRQTGEVKPATIRRFDPPRPQPSGNDGLILAEFGIRTYVLNGTMDCCIDYSCRLVTGSPAKNHPYTLILMSANEVKPAAGEMAEEQKE